MELLIIIVGLYANLLATGSDGAITTPPSNTAVLLGTPRIVMSCTTDALAEAISWSYLPVGGSAAVDITYGGLLVYDSQKQFYAVEKSGTQQNILTILSATMARAGTYYCNQGRFEASAQLIVINSDPVCSMTPNAPTELLYNQSVQMSCSVSYTANTSYVAVDMIWSKDSPATIVTSDPPQSSTSASQTTAVSTINQTPGNFTLFPIYRCNTTFKITGNPPNGSTNNAPDYSKSTSLFNSPINVIYLKPADASSITGTKDGEQVYLGTTVTCNVDANPTPSYSWLDVTYRNTTNTSTIQIWHSGVYQCTAWNRAASTSMSINGTTYFTASLSTTTTTTGGLSDGGKVGIGVGIGVGGALVLVGIVFAVLCRRYEWTNRIKTDDKRTHGIEEISERSGTHRDISSTPQYEPLNVLLGQNSNAGPTYAQLSTSTNVDAIEQDISERATYENLEYKLNANGPHSTEYEGLQQREQLPSDAYESIKP